MPTISSVTLIKDRYEIDLTKSLAENADYLINNRDVLISTFGEKHYEKMIEDTLSFYRGGGITPDLSSGGAGDLSVNPPPMVYSFSSDPDTGVIRKITNTDFTKEREIRSPYTKRIPDKSPFIISMVDRSLQYCGILINIPPAPVGGNTSGESMVISALKLTPNPSTITINSAKIINRYNTMTRWVEEYWGDEIDAITFSGSTYSFFAPDTSGLSLGARNNTDSYLWIKELIKFYQQNGLIYQDGGTYEGTERNELAFVSSVDNFLADNKSFEGNHPREGMVKERLYVSMAFDYFSVLGYFESFDVSEESSNPYRFTYNVQFKAEKTRWHQGSIATQGTKKDNW